MFFGFILSIQKIITFVYFNELQTLKNFNLKLTLYENNKLSSSNDLGDRGGNSI